MKILTKVSQKTHYAGFPSRTFTFHRAEGVGGGYFFNSSLPFPPTSLGNYWVISLISWVITAESSSVYSWQPDSNWEHLV